MRKMIKIYHNTVR